MYNINFSIILRKYIIIFFFIFIKYKEHIYDFQIKIAFQFSDKNGEYRRI